MNSNEHFIKYKERFVNEVNNLWIESSIYIEKHDYQNHLIYFNILKIREIGIKLLPDYFSGDELLKMKKSLSLMENIIQYFNLPYNIGYFFDINQFKFFLLNQSNNNTLDLDFSKYEIRFELLIQNNSPLYSNFQSEYNDEEYNLIFNEIVTRVNKYSNFMLSGRSADILLNHYFPKNDFATEKSLSQWNKICDYIEDNNLIGKQRNSYFYNTGDFGFIIRKKNILDKVMETFRILVERT